MCDTLTGWFPYSADCWLLLLRRENVTAIKKKQKKFVVSLKNLLSYLEIFSPNLLYIYIFLFQYGVHTQHNEFFLRPYPSPHTRPFFFLCNGHSRGGPTCAGHMGPTLILLFSCLFQTHPAEVFLRMGDPPLFLSPFFEIWDLSSKNRETFDYVSRTHLGSGRRCEVLT